MQREESGNERKRQAHRHTGTHTYTYTSYSVHKRRRGDEYAYSNRCLGARVTDRADEVYGGGEDGDAALHLIVREEGSDEIAQTHEAAGCARNEEVEGGVLHMVMVPAPVHEIHE